MLSIANKKLHGMFSSSESHIRYQMSRLEYTVPLLNQQVGSASNFKQLTTGIWIFADVVHVANEERSASTSSV